MPLESYFICFHLNRISWLYRKVAARRAEEGICNVGDNDNQDPPQDKVPSIEQVPMGGQVPVVPPSMTDGEIRLDFLNLAQYMTSQANAVTSQV